MTQKKMRKKKTYRKTKERKLLAHDLNHSIKLKSDGNKRPNDNNNDDDNREI